MNDKSVSPAEVSTDPVKKKHSCSSGRGMIWITFFLALIIGVASGISSYRVFDLHRHTGNKVNRLKKHQAKLQEQFMQSLAQQKEQIQVNQTAIDNLIALTSHHRSDWKLMQAKHLIQLANTLLLFEKNVPVAVMMLKDADGYLKQINSTQLTSLRKLIAEKVEELQSVPAIDREEIYLKLDALNIKINNLSWNVSEDKITVEKNHNEYSSKPKAWRRALDDTWRALTKVLIIRHHYQPIQPLLTVKERDLVNLNLHVWVTETQWALLRNEPLIYQNNLQKIQKCIDSYFDKDDAATKSIMNSLSELQKIKLSLELPALDDLLKEINQRLQSSAKRTVSVEEAIS